VENIEEEKVQPSSDTRNGEEGYIGQHDLEIVLNDSASRNVRRNFFVKHWSIIISGVVVIWFYLR
jgi:hypothetical protein